MEKTIGGDREAELGLGKRTKQVQIETGHFFSTGRDRLVMVGLTH